ncbi:MAG TPA: hypothetical protein VGA44_04535, partial [Steroidobacteraceae bacterium]
MELSRHPVIRETVSIPSVPSRLQHFHPLVARQNAGAASTVVWAERGWAGRAKLGGRSFTP